MQQEQIVLSRNGSRAVVRLMGGEMVSYRDMQGRERLHDGDPAIWNGFSPVLFPVIGFSKDGQVLIDGQRYPMPKHGLARTSAFDVENQKVDAVDMVFKANAQTLTHYPFDFELRVRYALLDQGFSMAFIVTNHDKRPMPFTLGGHPAFLCPMEGGERFEDYQLVFEKPETGAQLLVNENGLIKETAVFEPLKGQSAWTLNRAALSPIDTLILSEPASSRVSLVQKNTGKGIALDFPGFPVLAFWTKPYAQGQYLCIEPWHGLPSWKNEDCEMKDRPYAITLLPGESRQLTFTATVLD